jgi:hypothetical protein
MFGRVPQATPRIGPRATVTVGEDSIGLSQIGFVGTWLVLKLRSLIHRIECLGFELLLSAVDVLVSLLEAALVCFAGYCCHCAAGDSTDRASSYRNTVVGEDSTGLSQIGCIGTWLVIYGDKGWS